MCKRCCDHSSGFKPFINKAHIEVCLICCDHNITEKDNYEGNEYCLECFEVLPQSYCYLSPMLLDMHKREKERERKRSERKQEKLERERKRSERQTVVELKTIVKSLGIKGYSKLKKAELKALIASHKD